MKRIGIYFFYDTDGIVDNYVGYFLDAINQHLDRLVIVVNGQLTVDSHKYLENYSNDIIIRENTGFDVWAYKTALEYIGWDNLDSYDELILMNYTQFGPIYPFEEMFEKMGERKELDFWGITKYHRYNGASFNDIYDYIPEHLQSSFLVLRHSLFSSKYYHDFWDNMREVNTYLDSVGYYESIFTKKFNDIGFKSDSYVDSSDLEVLTEYPLLLMSGELIEEKRCPIIKRRSFFHTPYEYILQTGAETETRRALDYIKNNLDYDTSLIWDNILRTCNMRDIYQMLGLNYILPEDVKVEETDISKDIDKVGLVAHLYFEDQISLSLSYIKNVVSDANIFITTHSNDMKVAILKNLSKLGIEAVVQVIPNRGRDVSSLLVAARDFVLQHDLVCFVHDKKSSQVKPELVGKAFSEHCFGNTLVSKDYIMNVISKFKNNPKLGLLSPSYPMVGQYMHMLGNQWSCNFSSTKEFLTKNNINVPLDDRKFPIAPYGTMFWFRTEALKPLFEMKFTYEYFPAEPNKIDGTILHAIERAYPLVAQSQGYYSAYVYNINSAVSRINTLEFITMKTQMDGGHLNNYDGYYLLYRKIISKIPFFLKKPLKKFVKNFMK